MIIETCYLYFDCSFWWISMGNFFATLKSIFSAEIQWGFLPFLSFVCIKLLLNKNRTKIPEIVFSETITGCRLFDKILGLSIHGKAAHTKPNFGVECVGDTYAVLININFTLKVWKTRVPSQIWTPKDALGKRAWSRSPLWSDFT